MKKIKPYILSFSLLIVILLPFPFALAWGVGALPIVIICGYAAIRLLKALYKYTI